jgi:hypothetical protein
MEEVKNNVETILLHRACKKKADKTLKPARIEYGEDPDL